MTAAPATPARVDRGGACFSPLAATPLGVLVAEADALAEQLAHAQAALLDARRQVARLELAEAARKRTNRPLFRDIIGWVVAETGVSVLELESPTRARPVAWPRFAVVFGSRTLRPDISFPRLGRLLGDRDHTTIISAHRRAKQLRETDAEFGLLIDRMLAVFDAPLSGGASRAF